MAIGHIRDFNLSELNSFTKDQNAVDNLGGVGISEDIRLLVNNTNNQSVISSSDYEISGDFIRIINPLRIAFSNRTIVTVDSTECRVQNSNATNLFQLVNITTDTVFIPTGDIVRKDAVTYQDFASFNRIRFPSTIPESERNIASLIFSGNQTITDVSGEISVDGSIYDYDVVALISEVEESVNVYKFKRSQSVDLSSDNQINASLTLDGIAYIENLDSQGNPITVQNEITQDDPGIFIVSQGEAKRAFSDMSNPWDSTSNAGFISTQSERAIVETLTVNNPNITGISITSTSSTNISTATHRIPVIINGERYNLLAVLP